MTKKPDRNDLKSKVRSGYVQGTNLTVVAAAHGVPYATAVSWKTAAKKAGDDWDIARSARQMASSGAQEMFSGILAEVGAQYLHTLDLIKSNPDISVVAKGELLVKMVDGLSKTAKLAGLVSPEINELAVAMKVLKLLAEHIGENSPELRLQFVELLTSFGEELPRLLGVQ